jgi:hypothetical protein
MRFHSGQRSAPTPFNEKPSDARLAAAAHVRLAARGFAQVQFSRGHLWKVLPSAFNATSPKSAAIARSTAPFAKDRTTFVSAPMAFIIVRIAGKPAMFPWRAAVTAEPKNLHVLMDADARLAAAAGGAARFLADEAGLETEAGARLQSSVVAACKEAFRHLAPAHPHLEITFARFSDRLEISISHEGEAAVAGTRSASPKEQSKSNSDELRGVDRVQYEKHGKEMVTRLTKYLGKVAPQV